MMKLITISIILFSFFSDVIADGHRVIRRVYDEDAIYTIYTKVGYATTVQFEEGENLNDINNAMLGMGDVNAWEIGVKGRSITFKPKAKQPLTNVTIVTNKRTYMFDLKSTPHFNHVTYMLRFDYPESEEAKLARLQQAAMIEQITAEAKAQKSIVNTEYYWRGNHAYLKPTTAHDDGRFTFLDYKHSGFLPALYQVLPDGSEALVNRHIDPEDKSRVILHGVYRIVRARLNEDVIEIVNQDYRLPKFNEYGTTEKGGVRMKK